MLEISPAAAPIPVDHPLRSTVFIVDDDPDARQSAAMLVMSIGLDADCYASGGEFLAGYDRDKPGCVVLDYQMPGLTGLDVQNELNKRELPPPVLFVTGKGDVSFAANAMRVGAIDVLVKPVAPDAFLDRVRECVELDIVQRKECLITSEIRERISHLTCRELEIAQLLAAGDSCKQIARKLDICHKTVDNHQTHILNKLSLENPTKLAILLARVPPWAGSSSPGRNHRAQLEHGESLVHRQVLE